MSVLKQANQALREKRYPEAIKLYLEVIQSEPGLIQVVAQNLQVIRRRYSQATEHAKKCPKVGVCGWELSHNAAGRVYTLAQLYQGFTEVEIIGFMFSGFGYKLWEPIRDTMIAKHIVLIDDEKIIVEKALELVSQRPYDVVHISKPRMPNIIIGMLYKIIWGARVIVDIDDEELAFVGAEKPLNVEHYIAQHDRLPKLSELTGKEWTRLAVGMVNLFDGITVANPSLQIRYGGEIIRHARDENLFKPSADLKKKSRIKHRIPIDKKVVLFFGTPRAHKGLVETGRAIAAQKCSEVCFVIVGDFPISSIPIKDALHSIAGLECYFLGSQPFAAIPEIVAIGDICVLLQDEESLISKFQVPAKLSDALGMGLTILAEPTPALADLVEYGAFLPVSKTTLVNNLKYSLSKLMDEPVQSPVFKELFSFSSNRQALQKIINDKSTYSSEMSRVLELTWRKLTLGKFLPTQNLEPPLSSIDTPKKLAVLAKQANRIGDWTASYNYWLELFRCHSEELSADFLTHISQELFQLDAFPEAAKVLSKALEKEPNNQLVLRAQKDQYFYHAYSDWLMRTVEGEDEWFKMDSLNERPNWRNAAKFCKPFVNKSRIQVTQYDLKQYIQTILLFAEENWDRKNLENALRVLHEGLKPLTRLLTNDVTRSLFSAIEVIRCNPSVYGDEAVATIQTKLESLPSSTLASGEWLCLYDVLTWNGLLLVGNVVRRKAIEQAFQVADSNPEDFHALRQGVSAAMDQGNIDKAGCYLRKLEALKYDNKVTTELQAMLCLLEGDLQSFRKIWPTQQTEVDLQFREYLKGKSVAIVGPASMGSGSGDEIDRHDVVVRINYRGEASIRSYDNNGQRTDISLYNAHTVRLLSKIKSQSVPKGLHFYLTRRRQTKDNLPKHFVNTRTINEYSHLFYKSFNAVPALLFDLLLSGASELKLYNINFYLTDEQHTQGYRGRNEKDFSEVKLRKLQPILANHDLMAQLTFVKYLFKKNLILVDIPIKEILEIDERTYFETIQYLNS